MIERFIEACARNRFLVLVAVLLMVLGGIYSLRETPLDAIPDISDIQVIVYTPWEGRMFRPLALTKTFAMVASSILAVTLVPVLMTVFIRGGKLKPESENPVSRFFSAIYRPVIRFALKYKWTTLAANFAMVPATVFLLFLFPVGSEFMPPLYEGTIFYMPVTSPGLSVTEAGRLLAMQNRILKSFPEVVSVFGKAGRAETSTDPAPFSMMETVVNLKPQDQWRKREKDYPYLPGFLKPPARRILGSERPLSLEELIDEMDQKMQFPGFQNAWTMPIRGRIDMLATGIRTPVGIKIGGSDLAVIQELGTHIEIILKEVPGTRSVFAERVSGGYFTDIRIDREEIARYSLAVSLIEEKGGKTIMDAQINMKVVDPAGKAQIKMLKPEPAMKSHNGYFDLSGKGKYEVLVLFRIEERKRSAGILYEVK